MSKRTSFVALRCAAYLLLIGFMFAKPASETATANGGPTRLLRTPTVSATRIAFAYANNIWVVERAGGLARRLTSFQGKISPDGSRIAYRLNNSWDEERRNYRGGQNRPIWIVDMKSYDLVSPPWTDSKDVDPVWLGDVVYFLSDRDGVSNVWSYETKSKKLAQVTRFTDFDVKSIDSSGSAVVFEQAGVIHEL